MADLQTNLQRLENNSDEILSLVSDISDAIIAKGGTVPANTGLRGFANAINSIPSGGSMASRKDVNFYDYDGTIVNSYTAAEFAELTAMPSNPSHDGLTAQGWNWSLNDAKAYVAVYGKLEIGQMYVTSDGKTRLYITLIEGRTSPVLRLYLNANSELDIDWGDGSTHSTFTSTSADYKSERHNYASAGNYIIAVTVTTGSFVLQSSSLSSSSILWDGGTSVDAVYATSINKVELGISVSLGSKAFNLCFSISSITIPNSTIFTGEMIFRFCYSLLVITIPNSVTTIGTDVFAYIYRISEITIPKSVTSLSSAFNNNLVINKIKIANVEGALSGSPWGAPSSTQIIYTRHNNYQSSCIEVASGTTLTGTVNATIGDLVVATFEIFGSSYSISEGWTLLGDGTVTGSGNYSQKTGMAYKIATSTTETFTITQNTSTRAFIDMVSITGASIGSFSGYTAQTDGLSITMNKPNGLTIWSASTVWWGTGWSISNEGDNLNISTTRNLLSLDQSNSAGVTFTNNEATSPSGILAASLTITGIDNFWYYGD